MKSGASVRRMQTWRWALTLGVICVAPKQMEQARADAACRPLIELPVTISEPANYCLLRPMIVRGAGTAIAIEADSVVIDLHGHSLVAGSDLARGGTAIQGSNRQRVVIRNGSITGFRRGVALEGILGDAHVVERLRVEASREVGLLLEGQRNLVRKNVIVGTRSDSPGAVFGIKVSGPLARILDNVVEDTSGGGAAIDLVRANGCVVEGNRVRNQSRLPGSFGIVVTSGRNIVLVGNEISNVDRDVVWPTGSGVRRDAPVEKQGLVEAERSETEEPGSGVGNNHE